MEQFDYVVSSNTVNTFKHRLDKYWFDQDIKYNYKAIAQETAVL